MLPVSRRTRAIGDRDRYERGPRASADGKGFTMSSISIVRKTDAKIISPAFDARCL
jgi:hypothetical protein